MKFFKETSIAIAFLITLSLVTSTAFALNHDAGHKQSKKMGKATVSLKMDLTKVALTEQEKAEFIDMGWIIGKDTISRVYTFRNGKVKVNGNEVDVDNEGYFVVDENTINPKTKKSSKQSKVIQVEISGSEKQVAQNKDGEYIVNQDIDYESFMKAMESKDENANLGKTSAVGVSYAKGARVTCNRFNGYKGDQKYYANHFSSEALRNFAYSDCDWALALWTVRCVQDYTPWRYCTNYVTDAANAARCSDSADINPFAKHSRRYHSHTSLNKPTGL